MTVIDMPAAHVRPTHTTSSTYDTPPDGQFVREPAADSSDPTLPRKQSLITAVRGAGARLASNATVLVIHLLVWVGATVATLIGPASPDDQPRRLRGERGQATTEYALVLLAAALVALLVVAWATAGGGAGKISRLFNRVIDAVTGKI